MCPMRSSRQLRSSSPGTRPANPLIIRFIDQMRSQGNAVESICWGRREQGVAIAARTYRHSKTTRPSHKTVCDATLLDILHGLWGTPASLY